MKKFISNFEVVKNERIANNCSFLQLKNKDDIDFNILPGQFVNISVGSKSNAFLRRPISICDVNEKNSISILVKEIGEGTKEICNTKIGENLNILIPLGNSFSIPKKQHSKVLLIGGGVGIAPLLYLGRCLSSANHQVSFLLGASVKDDLYLLNEFDKIGEVFCTTIDGSYGVKGVVTDNEAINLDWDFIYSCGPMPMMKAIAKIAMSKNIPCEVSLENRMACGIGACLCCVEDTKDGNLCVCKNGPVFNINDLKW